MLLVAEGWGPVHVVTGVPGQWICLLTDTEPVLFQLRQDRRQHLRADIAARLERGVDGLTVVPSVPRLTDYFDRGYFTSGVGVATYDARAISDGQALYFLDLRPILCDFAWGFAHHGAILAETLVARLDQFAPAGFRSVISGAQIEHTDNGLLFHVRHGGFLVVDYVPREVASSSTEDDPSESSDHGSDGPPPDRDDNHVPADDPASAPDVAATECRLPHDAQPDSHLGRIADSPAVALQRFFEEPPGPPALRDPTQPDLLQLPHEEVEVAMPQAFADAAFVMLTPGYFPDVVVVPLALPATLDDVIAHLRDVRDDDLLRRFPVVIPAHPQPLATAAFFVALPTWAQDLVLAVFHIPARPARVFSSLVLSRVSREELLVTAGFGSASQVDVFVGGDQAPLQRGEQIVAFPGITVTIQPYGDLPPLPRSLGSMLVSGGGWDPLAAIPFATTPSLWVLTDQAPCRLMLEGLEDARLRDEIAAYVGIEPADMTLQAVSPRIDDFEDLGFGCSTIVVATQSISRILLDPATIILCDLRPILRGFTWRAVHGRELLVTTLLELLDIPCPAGYQLVVGGTPQHLEPTGRMILLDPGRCVVIELAEDLPEPMPVAIDALQSPDAPTDDAPFTEPSTGVIAPHAANGTLPTALPHRHGPAPEPGASDETSVSVTLRAGIVPSVCKEPWVDTCSRGFTQHALLESPLASTSVPIGPPGLRTWLLTLAAHALARFAGVLSDAVDVTSRRGFPLLPVVGVILHATLTVLFGACSAWGAALASLFVSRRCLHPTSLVWFALIYVWLCQYTVQAVQLPPGRTFALPSSAAAVSEADPTECDTLRPAAEWPRPRPLPTPCRQPALREATWSDKLLDEPWQHHTLLWQSCLQQEGYPFYEAATLLDTLIEQAEATFPTNRAQPLPPPAVIRLDALLPPPRTTGVPRPVLRTRPWSWPRLPHGLSWDAPLRIGQTSLGFTAAQLYAFLSTPADLSDWSVCSRLITGLHRHDGCVLDDYLSILRDTCCPGDLCFFTDGSFFPARPQQQARAGWAVVCIDPQAGAVALAFGHVPDFLMKEGVALFPYLAECTGLLAAGLIRINAFSHRRVVFCCDCTAALEAAAGRCTFQLAGLPQAMCSVHAFAQQLTGNADFYHYTPGHSGILGNEIADVASKFAARHLRISCGVTAALDTLQAWLSDGAPLLPWAAVAIQSICGSPDMPPLNTDIVGDNSYHQGLTNSQLLDPFLPLQALPGTPKPQEPAERLAFSLRLVCASFNVLSLGQKADDEGLAYKPARAALLAQQLCYHNVQVAMLQETRCQEGFSLVGPFLRFASASIRGQFGTEVWVRQDHPLLTPISGGCAPECLAKPNLIAVASDERRFLLRYTSRSISILFVALHAPHRANEACIIDKWWQETKRLLRHHRRDSFLVIGGDCNASVGSRVTAAVGHLAAEHEDLAGTHWHQVLVEFDLYLPATLDECHSGPSHTYTHKNGKLTCRPDYVAIPTAWQSGNVASWCEPAIHAAHSTPDHVAACVSAQLVLQAKCTEDRLRRRATHLSSIVDPACRDQISTLLRNAPQIGWDTSVHAHAAILAKHVQDGLARISTHQPSKPHHPYIQAPTWELQRKAAKQRRELHRLTSHIAHQTLAVSFKAWSRGEAFHDVRQEGHAWFHPAEDIRVSLQAELKATCNALRKACRSDRDAYVSNLAKAIATAPTKEAYASLHRLLMHKRKKPFKLDPLPMVSRKDGMMCNDSFELQARWREHFADLEAGRATSFQALADDILNQQQASPFHPPDIRDVPSLPVLRGILAKAKSGKAPGLDGVPPELNRFFASEATRMLFPLLLKIAWRGKEPAGFKGGSAITLYKGKGSHSACASFRSILLMGTWAKTMHQALRPCLRTVFEAHALPMQIGGRIGCGVTFGSHTLRTLARLSAQRGQACFVLFADISAAFYSALVQLIAHDPQSQTADNIGRALEGLALPDEAVCVIREHLQRHSALHEANASSWLEYLAADVSQGNWFLLAGDSLPVATGRGTRPGSSWADVLFAVLIPRILGRRDELLQTFGPLSESPTLPWDGDRTLTAVSGDAPRLHYKDVVWADDIATPKQCRHVSELPRAVSNEATALTEAFFEFGFRLSYGEHKTAALVTACGPGSRSVRRTLFGSTRLKGKVPILLEYLPSSDLPLPARYKHLGVQQMPSGGLWEEIRYRTAQARAAFAEARRKVFRSRSIPLKRRALILSSSVLSKLLLGAGSWPPLAVREYKLFSGTMWSLYRSVLGVKYAEDQGISASTCFSLLQLPDPQVSLSCARMSYLSQVLRAGPDPLWAAIRADEPYLRLLREDLDWIYAWVHSTSDLPNPRSDLQHWLDSILRSPGRFKGLYKRARFVHMPAHCACGPRRSTSPALSVFWCDSVSRCY